jgi:hypothetical protein
LNAPVQKNPVRPPAGSDPAEHSPSAPPPSSAGSVSRERPILFSAPMVRALLAGAKTQTRRVAKITAIMGNKVAVTCPEERLIELEPGEFRRGICHYESTGALSGPYDLPYAVGDRLWVKETFAAHWGRAEPGAVLLTRANVKQSNGTYFEASEDEPLATYYAADVGVAAPLHCRSVSSRFMPRWASRLTLIVTDVRVQRVQEISTDDCLAEGIEANDAGLVPVAGAPAMTAKAAYRKLWDSLNAKRGYAWETNPWVVALTFDVRRCNIELVARQA